MFVLSSHSLSCQVIHFQLDKTSFGTFGTARNSYTSRSDRQKTPNGQRIDYILFKGGHRAQVQCSAGNFDSLLNII